MNNTAKYLIGAAIGGGFGYILGSFIVDVLRARDELMIGETYTDADEPVKPLKTKEPVVAKKSKSEVLNYTTFYKTGDRPELEALVAKYHDGIEPGEQEKVLDELEQVEMGVQPRNEIGEGEEEYTEEDLDLVDPSIISVETYADADGYKKTILKYFEDDIVTDDKGNPLDRPERFLGEEALTSFGQLSGDEDIVYVRNEAKRAMYEVVRVNYNFVRPSTKKVKKEERDGEADES